MTPRQKLRTYLLPAVAIVCLTVFYLAVFLMNDAQLRFVVSVAALLGLCWSMEQMRSWLDRFRCARCGRRRPLQGTMARFLVVDENGPTRGLVVVWCRDCDRTDPLCGAMRFAMESGHTSVVTRLLGSARARGRGRVTQVPHELLDREDPDGAPAFWRWR